MMRPLAGAAALVLVFKSALAADVLNYSTPSAPSAYDWTGFHIWASVAAMGDRSGRN